MRFTLIALASVNLLLVLLVFPVWAYGSSAADLSHFARTEKILVDSGQLVLKPLSTADREPGKEGHAASGWLARQLAPNILAGNRDVLGKLAMFLMVQSVVFMVLAWIAPPIRQRVPATPGSEA